MLKGDTISVAVLFYDKNKLPQLHGQIIVCVCVCHFDRKWFRPFVHKWLYKMAINCRIHPGRRCSFTYRCIAIFFHFSRWQDCTRSGVSFIMSLCAVDLFSFLFFYSIVCSLSVVYQEIYGSQGKISFLHVEHPPHSPLLGHVLAGCIECRSIHILIISY